MMKTRLLVQRGLNGKQVTQSIWLQKASSDLVDSLCCMLHVAHICSWIQTDSQEIIFKESVVFLARAVA